MFTIDFQGPRRHHVKEWTLALGVKSMTKDKDTLLNEVHVTTDVKHTFQEIRETVEKAQSKEDLTELYKQTVYMILMTHSSPIDEKLDRDLRRRREITEGEFAKTVRLINKQAEKLGVEANFDENWERLATNGYETEGENILEAQKTVGVIKE
jgi:hypothetical protein